jgi:hypothetical protein
MAMASTGALLLTLAFNGGDGFEGKRGGTFGIAAGCGAEQGRVLLNLS